MDREEIKRIIIETLEPLGVERIGLFGSFSRREETAKSDIDILVRFAPPGRRPVIGLRWFSLDQELEEKIGRPIDLVSEESLSSLLKSIIERDLEIIYEKAG